MSKGRSVHRVPPLGTGRVGPQAAALIEARQAEGAGDGLGEQLDDIAEATHSMRTLVRCADSGSPCRVGAAGAAVRSAVAVGGVGEGYSHESVAVPPYPAPDTPQTSVLVPLPPFASSIGASKKVPSPVDVMLTSITPFSHETPMK